MYVVELFKDRARYEIPINLSNAFESKTDMTKW